MASAARPLLRRTLSATLVILAAIVAGCDATGGGRPPTDEDQIASTLRGIWTTPDLGARCTTAVSARFVAEVYGSRAQCRTANGPDPIRKHPARTANVRDTHVRGRAATTTLTLAGGVVDGISGRVALVKARDGWRLDRFGLDFARSAARVLDGYTPTPTARRQAKCLRAVAGRLPSGRLRRAVDAYFGERFDDLPAQMQSCRLAPSVARDAIERGTVSGFADDPHPLPAAFRRCILRRLRERIDEDELYAMIASRDGGGGDDLVAAANDC